jgi:hypothetical protein
MGVFAGIPVHSALVGCNGTFRSSEPFIVDGTITSKFETSGRNSGRFIVVHGKRMAGGIRLGLSHDAYQQARLGGHYREEFQIGLFGWPCR